MTSLLVRDFALDEFSFNDRRTPGINTLQLADHQQASNKPSVEFSPPVRQLRSVGA